MLIVAAAFGYALMLIVANLVEKFGPGMSFKWMGLLWLFLTVALWVAIKFLIS